ncbi:MAG: rod shape-determining protein [Candidatus Omnitrophica bacterium]|nr:rod shape-determining protein [Candidatus Omnitrophota bacterium]
MRGQGSHHRFRAGCRPGSEVDQVYPHSWSAAEALLSEEEKKSGVIVIDFGKGTTDFLIYLDGNLYGTYSVIYGGEYIDKDLSLILNISAEASCEIKKQYGWCNYPVLVEKKSAELEKQVELRMVGTGAKIYVNADKISKIVYERTDDIIRNMVKKIIENDLKMKLHIGAGIVLTGGSSQLKGLVDYVSNIFSRPARIGSPKGILGLPASYQYPCFSAVVGTLLLRKKEMEKRYPESEWKKKLVASKKKMENVWKKIWGGW